MKILIVRTTPNKMNLNTYNLQEIGLAKALIRKGNCCDVMYYCGKEKDHIEEITFDDGKRKLKILWLHGFGLFYEGIYPSLKKYVKEYDIIQVGGYVGITSVWLNRHLQHKIINYQGPYYCAENKGDIKKAKIWDRLLLPLSHKKNMIVATKSILATQYVQSKGISNVTTIGVGLDLDNLKNDSINENEFIRSLQNKEDKYLLYVGVLEPRRNILFLLDVFKKVAERIPECKLVIIGKGKPDYVTSCFEKIDKLDIKNKIIYKESLEQKYVQGVYKLADAFLLPTRYEIFGMVLLEAMYYGLPVFTTYNGGSSTLMNEQNGVIIPTLNEDVWSNKIVSLLNDKETCKRIGTAAHFKIANEFTWDALADKFLDVYNKRLLNNSQKVNDFNY